jgi:hypothetical protein
MLKNVNSQIGPGSQNEIMKTPNISHLTGIARSFHFQPKKKIKPRYRIIFGVFTYMIYPVYPTIGEARYFDNVTGREKFLAHGGVWI